jgi:formylglycine-generating enzyme required for sulfatase activity
MKAGATTPSPETSAAMVSLETAVAEITESFLKSAKAEGLSFEGLKSLLSTAGKAALAAIRATEQALEELKAAEDQQRQKKDEEKPAKKTTKKAAAKSKSVESSVPAAHSTWFYLNEANEAQQADLGVLADLIKAGVLTRQSHAWREGWAEWREIGQVEELAKFFGGKRQKSPPPLPGGSELRAGDTAVFGGIEFVWCPPGTFWMGSREDEVFETTLDETAHQVTLTRGFWIGKYPVTQRQWLRVMGGNPSEFLSAGLEAPVDSVSWEDADLFCDACRILEEVQFRLPTEAEWEYACRAGSTGTWCFGDDEAELGEYAWFGENSDDRTHPVGRKKPNAWGIHDMHGNTWEWCADWYNPYPKGAVTDPSGGEPVHRNNYGGGLIAEMYGSGPIKVYRGGFFGSKAENCRSAARLRGSYSYFGCEGFRVAVSST